MKKGVKITISVISSVLALILIFLAVYFFWPWNRDFFEKADKEFAIPGLDTTFVPQGMTRIDAGGDIVISGYMSDGSPSRFYVLDGETKTIKKYFTLDIDGKDYKGHAGGVASYGNYIYTSSVMDDGNGYVFEFYLSDLNNVTSGYEISVRKSYHTYNTADYLFVKDDLLWVGEFHRDKKYQTKESHWITTRSGELNKAVVFAFELNKSSGIISDSPSKALSTRSLCQGVEVTQDGKFVMSTSYSLPDSTLYYYDSVLDEDNDSTIDVCMVRNIPLWFLYNKALISSKKIPSMSEEI